MLAIIHMVQLFFSFRHCITSHLYDSISSNSVFDFSPIIPHGAVSKLGTLQSFSLWFPPPPNRIAVPGATEESSQICN